MPLKLNFTNKVPALLLLLISVLVVYLAFRMFLSALNGHQVMLFLEDWQLKQALPSQQAWLVAKESVHKAEHWSPVADAFLQEKIGKIYEWNAYSDSIGDKAVYTERSASLNAYREQTRLTPLWPNAWLNIVAIKMQLNEFDHEFANALLRAEQVSNSHPEAIYRLAGLGIQAWPNLTSPQKSKVLRAIGLSISQNKKNASRLQPSIEQKALKPILCYYLRTARVDSGMLCKGFET